MAVVVIDFETYYDVEYSLSKISTEEYIRSPKFEVIGVAISHGGPPTWYAGKDVEPALRAIDWDKHALLAWNTAFDGAILGWHYGLYPKLYLDAMGMARGAGWAYMGASLAKVAEVMGVGRKGTEVVQAKGKHLADFTPQELAAYGAYCVNDVNLTAEIYRRLIVDYPRDELRLQDQVLRMFIEPTLLFDGAVLGEYYEEVVAKKQEALRVAAEQLGATTEEELTKKLMSNPQFAKLLESLGVDPPMKLSKTTGKMTYAFSKTDPELLALAEHEEPAVQAVVGCRLATKSTIEETRALRFINIQQRGVWPVAYTYYGAHTGRLSGADKVNPQNLKRGGKLRDAILPPPGHHLVAADLSQIEARLVNYLAEQHDMVEAFRQYDAGTGPDVYCLLAGKIYGRPITPENKRERTVGKIGELSLGFGAADGSYKQMLFAQAKINIDRSEAMKVVDIYRRSHRRVEQLWWDGQDVLKSLVCGQQFRFGRFPLLHGSNPAAGIGLPNGMYIRYPKLHQVKLNNGNTEYVYISRGKEVKIYGAKVVENCVQALARIIMTDAWLRISTRYRVVLSTHDELVVITPKADVEEAKAFLHAEMTREVPWAPDLPLACTVGAGANYGEAH